MTRQPATRLDHREHGCGTRDASAEPAAAVDTETKVDFLRLPQSYPERHRSVVVRQTHMSWVFVGEDRVYKLKKPVRFDYLDYSTRERREAACRAECAVNQCLARDIYLSVVPLVRTDRGLAIGGEGQAVDWLVVMRRLAEERMLENALLAGTVSAVDCARLIDVLSDFYLHARPVFLRPDVHRAMWQRRLRDNRRGLADPRFGLEQGMVARIDRAQRRFLSVWGRMIDARSRAMRIVDGHGDLRPEHIWLGNRVAIIDRLEFDPTFRQVDPIDELAFLGVECEALGFPEIGYAILGKVAGRLSDGVDPMLLSFYRSYRATLRARLAIAHLSEPDGRPTDEWRPKAIRYLSIAADAAHDLQETMNRLGRRHE